MIEEKKKELQKKKSSTADNNENVKTIKNKKDMIKSVYRDLMSNFYIPKRFKNKSFNNFDSRRLENKNNPYEKVKEYVKTFPERDKNGDWLILSGGYGLGKTHLAIAAAKEIMKYYAKKYIEENPNSLRYTRTSKKIIFVNSSELVQEIRDSYDSDMINEQKVMNSYKMIPLLIIDDLGTEKASEWQHEKIYMIMNYRYNEELCTIVTTNLDHQGLEEQISARVVDRMIHAAGGGKFLWKFEGESYRRRRIKKGE